MRPPSHGAEARSLSSVLITDQLRDRPVRSLHEKTLNVALVKLAQVMANAPETILQRLVEAGLELCEADSCGISLLDETDALPEFRWVAVAGGYAPLLHGTIPRNLSPCGTVLDTDAIQLMQHPELHFTNLAGVEPRCAEVLLIPFHSGNTPVGTIWIVSHTDARKFDLRDAEVMITLSEFAAAAYKVETMISELEHSRSALVQVNRSLENAYTDLQSFAFAASHDLQEPLRNVISFLQLLQRHLATGTDHRAQELSQISLRAALRMRTLLDALLSYSRLENEHEPMSLVDLEEVVDDAIANLKSLVDENNAVVTRDDLPQVVGSKSQLTSLFQNLISNAIKYRRNERPRVHLTAAQDHDYLQIAVTDNGLGFSQDLASYIFAPFRRLHGPNVPGTGMGLAICQNIVRRHGGSIRATSIPGKASTFFVTLPLTPARAALM